MPKILLAFAIVSAASFLARFFFDRSQFSPGQPNIAARLFILGVAAGVIIGSIYMILGREFGQALHDGEVLRLLIFAVIFMLALIGGATLGPFMAEIAGDVGASAFMAVVPDDALGARRCQLGDGRGRRGT